MDPRNNRSRIPNVFFEIIRDNNIPRYPRTQPSRQSNYQFPQLPNTQFYSQPSTNNTQFYSQPSTNNTQFYSQPSANNTQFYSQPSTNNTQFYLPHFQPFNTIYCPFPVYISVPIQQERESDTNGVFNMFQSAIQSIETESIEENELRDVVVTLKYSEFCRIQEHTIESGQLNCIICLDLMQAGTPIKFLNCCGTSLHVDCAHDWLCKRKVTCPHCRKDQRDQINEDEQTQQEQVHQEQLD